MSHYFYRRLGGGIISLILVMATASAVAQAASKEKTLDCAGYDVAAQQALQFSGGAKTELTLVITAIE